jgi:hypothetical protein
MGAYALVESCGSGIRTLSWRWYGTTGTVATRQLWPLAIHSFVLLCQTLSHTEFQKIVLFLLLLLFLVLLQFTYKFKIFEIIFILSNVFYERAAEYLFSL